MPPAFSFRKPLIPTPNPDRPVRQTGSSPTRTLSYFMELRTGALDRLAIRKSTNDLFRLRANRHSMQIRSVLCGFPPTEKIGVTVLLSGRWLT
jgi:hypothetical protein